MVGSALVTGIGTASVTHQMAIHAVAASAEDLLALGLQA